MYSQCIPSIVNKEFTHWNGCFVETGDPLPYKQMCQGLTPYIGDGHPTFNRESL